MIRLTTPAIVLRLPDGFNCSRLVGDGLQRLNFRVADYRPTMRRGDAATDTSVHIALSLPRKDNPRASRGDRLLGYSGVPYAINRGRTLCYSQRLRAFGRMAEHQCRTFHRRPSLLQMFRYIPLPRE